MPIEIVDLEGGTGNLISGMGVITEEDFVDTLRKHLTENIDKFKKHRYSLCDYTEVTKVGVSTDAIILVSDLCKNAAIDNPDAIVAVVANCDLIYGLSRMMQILLDGTPWEFGVFREREDAESWINDRVKESYGIDVLAFGSTPLKPPSISDFRLHTLRPHVESNTSVSMIRRV